MPPILPRIKKPATSGGLHLNSVRLEDKSAKLFRGDVGEAIKHLVADSTLLTINERKSIE